MKDKAVVDTNDEFGFGLFSFLPPAIQARIRRVEIPTMNKDEPGTNDVPVEPAADADSFDERQDPDIAEGLD